VAVEDIGGLYNTKQPGYDDTADIQAALKAFLYGDYDYDITRTDTNFPNPSLARHLQLLSNRVTAQETLGIGSDYYPTITETGQILTSIISPVDGQIAMVNLTDGSPVETNYASATYSNEAPTIDLVNGMLWIDKDSEAKDIYVYDSSITTWVPFNSLKNIVQAKGDILIGSSTNNLDNLTVGANGTVLTADDTQALGVKWQAPSVYSQPTLGTTAIASGATVSNVNDLTINSTTIPTSKTLVATDSTEYVIPSMSGNSGKYLTNDGSTPSWGTVSSSSGLTLITSQSFTNSTSIQLNNCFSSTYRNYRVMLSVTGISANSSNIYFRYSTGGSPNSSAIYSFTALDGGPTSSPTASAGRNLTATQFECGYYDPGYSPNNQMPYYATMDIFAPYIGQYEKGMLGFSCSTYATAPINTYVKFWSGWCLSNASFDGFQIRPQGADGITGIIRVYGYQD
jgi:hypothetical protein